MDRNSPRAVFFSPSFFNIDSTTSPGVGAPAENVDLIMTSIGSRVISVARTIAVIAPSIDPAALGAGVDAEAVPILRGVTRDAAEAAQRELEEAGATVEIRPAV